jgi:hypothetical protein
LPYVREGAGPRSRKLVARDLPAPPLAGANATCSAPAIPPLNSVHGGSRTPSTVDRAERILPELFGSAGDEAVSRHSALQRLGGGPGRRTLAERRRWAEAWQLLERAGLICREPDESRRDWFLTGAGKQALAGGDIAGAIMQAHVNP